MPSERLRKLEVDANTAFDQYREMYFEGGVSSVYLWDLDHGFAGEITTVMICCMIIRCESRCYSDQEGRGWRLKEDQGVLGLHPRCRGSGEELRPVSPLQADQHEHALAADQQGETLGVLL